MKMRFTFDVYLKTFGITYLACRVARRCCNWWRDGLNGWVVRLALGEVGRGVVICRGVVVDIPARVRVGPETFIGPYTALVSERPQGSLILGRAVHIVGECFLDFTGGVVIEDEAFLSRGCVIYTHDHGYDPRSAPCPTPLRVGKRAWIGARCVIAPGVRYIGQGAIVGMGAIVTRAVEDGEVVAGNPARLIRRIPGPGKTVG